MHLSHKIDFDSDIQPKDGVEKVWEISRYEGGVFDDLQSSSFSPTVRYQLRP
jgi:hypothetical protein